MEMKKNVQLVLSVLSLIYSAIFVVASDTKCKLFFPFFTVNEK